MWRLLIDLGRRILSLGQESDRHTKAIERLQDQDEKLALAFRHLAVEHQQVLNELARLRDLLEHNRTDEQREREILQLRLENEMLKFERRLPSPASAPPPSKP